MQRKLKTFIIPFRNFNFFFELLENDQTETLFVNNEYEEEEKEHQITEFPLVHTYLQMTNSKNMLATDFALLASTYLTIKTGQAQW